LFQVGGPFRSAADLISRSSGRAAGSCDTGAPSQISGALNRKQQYEAIPKAQTPEARGLSDIVFDPTNIEEMEQRLEELRARHRELDDTIAQLKLDGGHDIRVMGLKREKLRIKDSIVWLSSKLTPDIIA
jgi:hypothetical protein